MSSCNTRKNQIIGRCGNQLAIFYNMAVAVGAFCNPSARSVEYRLICSGFLSLLSCHNRRDQIQSFNITVEKSGIFRADQFDGFHSIGNLSRFQHDPEISRTFCKYMIPDSGSSGQLIIYKQIARIHLIYHFLKEIF